MNKDIQKFLKQLKKKKWTVTKGTKHYKCYHPDGSTLNVVCTPSDSNFMYDIKRNLRRIGHVDDFKWK